ncbi:hypothetical protein ANO14919_139820 [Xylariales sp. No.14919]|nr:hypothetical protein ANO14919_139820 [Xylariales sp. No.14919]
MIALHGAGSPKGAQLYMECAQINISGGTAKVSPATYSIPGIYKQNDPGLLVNIYQMTSSSSYTIPGPNVFTCASGSGGSGSGQATTSQAGATTTLVTSTKTSAAGSAPTCTVAQWAQCGGSGFTGCTTCASPYACNQQNQYYSQCS